MGKKLGMAGAKHARVKPSKADKRRAKQNERQRRDLHHGVPMLPVMHDFFYDCLRPRPPRRS